MTSSVAKQHENKAKRRWIAPMTRFALEKKTRRAPPPARGVSDVQRRARKLARRSTMVGRLLALPGLFSGAG